MLTNGVRLHHTLSRAQVREWFASLLLLPFCIYFCTSRGQYTMLDDAALILHEAGHFIFGFFGPALGLVGGTLMQILLPGALAWHFYRRHYRLGIQVMLVWLGHNVINISVYAADARSRRLPLLGGERVMHDWNVMLGNAGLLHYDFAIGQVIFLLAFACFVTALVAPLFVRPHAIR